MEGTWQLSSRKKVIPGMGGLDVGGPGMGGRHGFNFFLAFTVLFSFVMAVPAQAQDSKARPTKAVINGKTVTLTYADLHADRELPPRQRPRQARSLHQQTTQTTTQQPRTLQHARRLQARSLHLFAS